MELSYLLFWFTISDLRSLIFYLLVYLQFHFCWGIVDDNYAIILIVTVVVCRIKCWGKLKRQGLKREVFPVYCSIYISCSAIANNNHFWHKKLDHPNSAILKHIVTHDSLNNTNREVFLCYLFYLCELFNCC